MGSRNLNTSNRDNYKAICLISTPFMYLLELFIDLIMPLEMYQNTWLVNEASMSFLFLVRHLSCPLMVFSHLNRPTVHPIFIPGDHPTCQHHKDQHNDWYGTFMQLRCRYANNAPQHKQRCSISPADNVISQQQHNIGALPETERMHATHSSKSWYCRADVENKRRDVTITR